MVDQSTAAIVAPQPERSLVAWRFRLRSLLIVIAAALVLLSLLARLDTAWSTVVLWSLALMAAHVAGAALGSNVYGGKPTLRVERRLVGPTIGNAKAAPTTRLGSARSLPGWLLAPACGGALLGGLLSTALIALACFHEAGVLGLTIAACSGAVLGALFGFLVGSFLAIASGAWREAERNGQHPTNER